MYSIFFFISCAILGVIVLDSGRLRELLPGGLAGSVFASLPLSLVGGVLPFHYQDTPPMAKHVAISLVVQVVAAPMLGMWYVQHLRDGWLENGVRLGLFVGLAMTFEGMGRQAGRVFSQHWWDWKASFALYLLFFLTCQGAYRLYHSKNPAGDMRHARDHRPSVGG